MRAARLPIFIAAGMHILHWRAPQIIRIIDTLHALGELPWLLVAAHFLGPIGTAAEISVPCLRSLIPLI